MKVLWAASGWEDFQFWLAEDPKTARRIADLIDAVRRSPFSGIGKPEPLRGRLAGWWSRRVGSEHRLVYRVAGSGDDQRIEIVQCRFHYGR